VGKVSQETIEKLNAFIDSLPAEARSKCALCNETLTHIVKQAEAKTGAGTATVTRALSEKINENAAPRDQVSGGALQDRVRRNEGLKMADRQNKPAPKLSSDAVVEAIKRGAFSSQEVKKIVDAVAGEILNGKLPTKVYKSIRPAIRRQRGPISEPITHATDFFEITSKLLPRLQNGLSRWVSGAMKPETPAEKQHADLFFAKAPVLIGQFQQLGVDCDQFTNA
jgi:hypothetical protein